MISQQMQKLLSKQSFIRQMFEEGTRLKQIYGKENVYDFSLGNPNFPAPEQVNKAIIDIVSNNDSVQLHGYMKNSGFESVRQSIANKLNKEYSLNLDFSNIVMTVGAAGGLNVLFKSILDAEDEVIVIAPYFGEYANYVANYNAKLVVVPPNFPNFLPNIESLYNLITSKTKAVIINSPNNPTGVIYGEKVIKDIAECLNRRQKELGTAIYLVADEPYRELAYDGVQVPYVPNYYDNTIVGYSYSKSLSLAGERIGYLVIAQNCDSKQELVAACNVATRILGFVNAPSLQQLVIEKCLYSSVDICNYDNNRKLLVSNLTAMGYECTMPQGAFYLFIKTPIANDIEFCSMAKDYNILIVPGSAFECSGYARIAYCVAQETIINSLAGFEKLAQLTIKK